jgi:hypothetical protein
VPTTEKRGRVPLVPVLHLGDLTLLFSSSSCCRPHRSTHLIDVHPLFFPIHCKSLNQSVPACYSLPCISNLILADSPPMRIPVLLLFSLTPLLPIPSAHLLHT